ncbi:MAG: type I DNA topoisomerase [bacterium]|nr:type I DNA topoisomerase [bacterium]
MAKDLIIVESPTKAKTLTRFLGGKYIIEASFGHIRDLPKSKMGVNEETLDIDYVIPKEKIKRVNELKKIAEGASRIILATDPDREGEAIAWHILQILSEGKTKKAPKATSKTTKKAAAVKAESNPIKEIAYERIAFHEITEHAIKEALDSPRKIDRALVDAQQARRVLDRLVGYKLSPLLWRKIRTGLSAGRVQSVAVRLIVDREREIEAFKSEEYWSVDALFEVPERKQDNKFIASLFKINDRKIAIKTEAEVKVHVKEIQNDTYMITSVIKKEVRKYAVPPFTTSTLQQNASNKLGFSAKKTMMLAQSLYENGLISYMRTDSVNLSEESITATREFISKEYGNQYLPEKPKVFKTKSKVAQEAHEAIRPTDVNKTPGKMSISLEKDQLRLYSLIWNRTTACQMKEAIYDQTTIDITSQKNVTKYLFRAVGRIIKFDGWLRVYGVEAETEDVKEQTKENTEENADDKDIIKENTRLPDVSEGQDLNLQKVTPEQHFTQPPPRYTEAALVKALEERGIGRPSTYAPTISTIQDRKYIEREQKALKPTPIGIAVNDFLMANFPDIMDFSFTADMEQELDDVANGEAEWKPMLKAFLAPFSKKVEATQETAERVKVATEEIEEPCPTCGNGLVVRFGRFGKFISCSTYPDCKYTRPFVTKVEGQLCPKDGGQVIMRKTKKGRPFYGCSNYPKCDWASWTKPVSPETNAETNVQSPEPSVQV